MPRGEDYVGERERQSRRRQAVHALAEADKVSEIRPVPEPSIVVKEDGTIPLATIGNEERRLRPAVSAEEAGATPEVVQALNARVATNEMASVVNTGKEAKKAAQQLIWRYWVAESRSWGATTSATSIPCDYYGDNIWPQWTRSTGTTTNALAYTQAWYKWTENEKFYRHAKPYRPVPPPPPSPEEQARRQALRDQEEAARKGRVAALEYAKEKSHKLLLSVLDPQQKEELKTKGHFHCKSQKGFVYRIYTGTHGNVKRLDERGKEVESLCIQPDNVPVYDAMLAQKLHIEMNEDEFRKTANISRVYN